jgi:hypothetical protein
MKILKIALIYVLVIFSGNFSAKAQQTILTDTIKAGQFDMGKMWTFDYPPVDYFSKAYNFTPNDAWFEKARLSALRFASYCSASFVSADGLVMTNHHCARESGTASQLPNENFNENGFYAQKLSDERRVKELYVDQLVKIADITERVQKVMEQSTDRSQQIAARKKEFGAIVDEYKTKDDWKGLEIQTVTFYSGGKYALYGFKRYNDVRLVFMPELNLGFFGGDYDNFTYPRYDLDCSFFRVYNEKGQPLKTPNYYKFSTKPVSEDEPVFIIGNPGTTGRLWTMSDLKYRKDNTLPINITYLKNRSKILKEYNKRAKSDSIINEIFSYENSIKALGGELNGLYDEYLVGRKEAFEKKFKNDVLGNSKVAGKISIWNEIENANSEMSNNFTNNVFFGGNPTMTGETFAFALTASHYLYALKNNRTRAAELKKRLQNMDPPKIGELDKAFFISYLKEMVAKIGNTNPFTEGILKGKSPVEAADYLFANTKLKDKAVWNSLASGDSLAIEQIEDPMIDIAKTTSEVYIQSSSILRANTEKMSSLRSELGRILFELYGTNIPPDATFSLRIADGIVKGYDYNGTKAPYQTTFFGLYDRFYSFSGEESWRLPKRWHNPPKELLTIPMNFASTNDITGGNSGSPVINRNLEVVGLVFDGNMESLPGRFIFVPDANRSVSVSSTGMLGALKYIYKANRLEKELRGN